MMHSSLLKNVEAAVDKEADDFIEEIKKKIIKKAYLPNQGSRPFKFEEAQKSFEKFLEIFPDELTGKKAD